MPRGNGTGPFGKGAGTGRGMGRVMGAGNRSGRGPGGHCVCPACGTKVAHQPGTPCTTVCCSQCGTMMVRG